MKSPPFSQTIREDLGTLCRALGMIRAAAPRLAAATAALTLVEALLPAASIWLLKHIIDTVATVGRGGSVSMATDRTALGLAGSYLLLVCLQQSVRAISRYVEALLDDHLNGKLRLQMMEKASSYPDLSPFESPCFHDRLALLQRGVASRPMNLKDGLVQGVQASLTLIFMLLFLARFHPGLALVLAVTAAPGLLCQRRLRGRAWYRLEEVAPLRRRLADYAGMLLSAPYAKEVRLFGFSSHILGRYREQFDAMIVHVQRTRWRLVCTSLVYSLLASLGVGGVFVYVIGQALRGALTLGDLSLYTGALFQANAAAVSLVGAFGQVHEALPFVRELFTFLDSEPTMTVRAPGDPVCRRLPGVAEPRGDNEEAECPTAIGRGAAAAGADHPLLLPSTALRRADSRRSRRPRGFRFERVAFRYPETDRRVFDGLELEIPWEKTTALVGENGAGKSTLVKLLARLYDPTAGAIFLDGTDLRDYDLEDLRRQIAVVFQDFARYQLPVWENIGLGDIRRLGDRRRISEAARRAGADGVIRRLPQGEETLLGREFSGGVELSGGEWQKIALARAFMRDASLLILDEPTAALDARSEYEVYRRFRELAAGRTTLLISHRFSTVQIAEHIIVLEDGQVIEEGDHRGLVAHGGRYAELYAMQAERYQL